MYLNVPINFKGNYHHIEISEGAQLQIGHGVVMRSFTSLEVSTEGTLVIGDRVFLMIIVRFVAWTKLLLGMILCLGMGCVFLILIISLIIIMYLRHQ